ncbi:dienelactone hydrolase family protein [Burkholderia cenocepacia]|uniref:dienelactone hydrolase family protein n=1 Tax=Burkholderia cenocepacia TaxID=95486 RepID=UPI000F573BD2|nr:dienelactone hydrolase family protein [Burkholderia cenocepacia]RQU32815.1 dienelactone hydrolase family protein [Burkholderia cenocepacia]RQU55188.1 dienelactone hydrolase family protein [Burkholderia cenocepacia]
MLTDWITLDTVDGPMRGFVAHPDTPPTRAVLVLQEAFGVNAHMQDITRRFAQRGFLAVAPDLFHRSGVAEFAYDRHTEAVAAIASIGADQITVDVAAALDSVRTDAALDAHRCAVVGFCFGGRAAFTAAAAFPSLGAAVVFYGGGIAAGPHALLDRADRIEAPLLLHVGDADPVIPPAQIDAVDDALTRAKVAFEQHVYAGAGHAFACDARPAHFRPDAAALAWERTFAFLDAHLPARLDPQ